MFIRSERLFLRPAWAEDATDLHAAIADERVVRNLVRAPWPYAVEDARAFVERPQDRRFPSLLINLPTAGGSHLIGGIGLHDEAGKAHLGYWLTPELWGRGFATEAASALLRVAGTLGHAEIGAHHFVDNPGSGRVLEKLGFRRIGQAAERHSLGRACARPSFTYLLRLDGTSNCDGDPPPAGDWDMGRRAA